MFAAMSWFGKSIGSPREATDLSDNIFTEVASLRC